jgi:hypothetical protein
MQHMVKLKYPLEQRDAALAFFQEHGMTHYDGGLVVKGLWVATAERIAYVLVEATDAADVESACRALEPFGEVEQHTVIAADQL